MKLCFASLLALSLLLMPHAAYSYDAECYVETYNPPKFIISVNNGALFEYRGGRLHSTLRYESNNGNSYCYSNDTTTVCLGKFIEGKFSYYGDGVYHDYGAGLGECTLIK